MKVTISNKDYDFEKGVTLEEILNNIEDNQKNNVVAALVNNQIYDLTDQVKKDSKVKFVTINGEIGNRIYRRSLFLVMAKAIYKIFPEAKLSIEHSLSNGIYCEIHKNTQLNQKDLKKIKKEMNNIVKKNIPIVGKKFSKDKLTKIYTRQGFIDKVDLLEQLNMDKYPVYELDGYFDYLFYNMVPRTGLLDRFDLHYRLPGFILLYPQRGEPEKVPSFKEQPKLANIFHEYEKWGEIIGIEAVNDLNKFIIYDKYGDLIRVNEALHEKKIANMADKITENLDKNRVILIAGPSSSGKTTFAQRLAIQLRVNGLQPLAISTDNYFVNREETPLDEDGNYDFESIEAIDLKLFNRHLIDLLQGKEVEIPIFSFKEGIRKSSGQFMQIDENQPIIIEGIHGLNDRLTNVIPEDSKFKIYVSALTQLNLDCHNRIPTTDTRLIRRIVRDNLFRNHTAEMTIDWWPGVRKGEEKNIFPYQENADIMFNSALIYELSVLKKYAEPLLEDIKPDQSSYYQAQRLLGILRCFKEIPEDNIPQTSIIKEFTGGGAFN
ncbi:MAG: nucleoside kinase [bacterium]